MIMNPRKVAPPFVVLRKTGNTGMNLLDFVAVIEEWPKLPIEKRKRHLKFFTLDNIFFSPLTCPFLPAAFSAARVYGGEAASLAVTSFG